MVFALGWWDSHVLFALSGARQEDPLYVIQISSQEPAVLIPGGLRGTTFLTATAVPPGSLKSSSWANEPLLQIHFLSGKQFAEARTTEGISNLLHIELM